MKYLKTDDDLTKFDFIENNLLKDFLLSEKEKFFGNKQNKACTIEKLLEE